MARHTPAQPVSGVPTAARSGRWRRVLLASSFGVPAIVLLLAYVWLAAEHGTARLWNELVHESGRYTLAQTVLYVDHFLRELPIDLAYAFFLLAAAPAASGANSFLTSASRARLVALACGMALLVLVAGAVYVSARAHGWASAARDLFQFRTRDDVVAYGSHWRYHLLSTVWFGAAVAVLARAVWGAPESSDRRAREKMAWGYVAALTIVFGISARIVADVRYVGHQAREILTHAPVTMLLGMAIILAATGPFAGVVARNSSGGARLVLYLAVALFVPIYLAGVALTGDVLAEGQAGGGLAGMVAGHYFEHALDYLFVALLVLGGLALRAAQQRPPGVPAHAQASPAHQDALRS